MRLIISHSQQVIISLQEASTMLSFRCSSSPSTSSRRRRSAAMSPMALSPAALLLLRGVSGSDATSATVIESPASSRQYRLFPVRVVANPPAKPLNECEGDCDDDNECADGLVCYLRDANEEVPGCTGGKSDNSRTDYCIRPADQTAAPITLATPTHMPTHMPTPKPSATMIMSPTAPLNTNTTTAPTSLPTPFPTPLPTSAPTATPTPRPVQVVQKTIKFVTNPPKEPLGECEGDCDGDHECADGLICHERDPFDPVPGCDGGESSGRYTDYCIRPAADTDSPTISASPTPHPTISTMPSVSIVPTLLPTFSPTPAPNSISEKFRLRLYWNKSYFWQETRKETFWCWQCRGGCKSGNLIEIDHCRNADYFQYYGEDDSYRPASNPDLCVTEDGFGGESRPIRLKKCNGSYKQKWVNTGWKDPSVRLNYNKQQPWEIHPESNMGMCVTQMHHPKAHERVFIRRCAKPRINDTSQWVTYK